MLINQEPWLNCTAFTGGHSRWPSTHRLRDPKNPVLHGMKRLLISWLEPPAGTMKKREDKTIKIPVLFRHGHQKKTRTQKNTHVIIFFVRGWLTCLMREIQRSQAIQVGSEAIGFLDLLVLMF